MSDLISQLQPPDGGSDLVAELKQPVASLAPKKSWFSQPAKSSALDIMSTLGASLLGLPMSSRGLAKAGTALAQDVGNRLGSIPGTIASNVAQTQNGSMSGTLGEIGAGANAGLQSAGQVAGALNDVTKNALGATMSGYNEKYLGLPGAALGKAGEALAQTPIGQLGIAALRAGGQAWDGFTQSHPNIAADATAIAQLAQAALTVKAVGSAFEKARGQDIISKPLQPSGHELNNRFAASSKGSQPLSYEVQSSSGGSTSFSDGARPHTGFPTLNAAQSNSDEVMQTLKEAKAIDTSAIEAVNNGGDVPLKISDGFKLKYKAIDGWRGSYSVIPPKGWKQVTENWMTGMADGSIGGMNNSTEVIGNHFPQLLTEVRRLGGDAKLILTPTSNAFSTGYGVYVKGVSPEEMKVLFRAIQEGKDGIPAVIPIKDTSIPKVMPSPR